MKSGEFEGINISTPLLGSSVIPSELYGGREEKISATLSWNFDDKLRGKPFLNSFSRLYNLTLSSKYFLSSKIDT